MTSLIRSFLHIACRKGAEGFGKLFFLLANVVVHSIPASQTPQTTHLTPGPHINQSVGIHDTKARVPCLDCERTFGRRSEMLRHARKHNEALARSFKCPIPSCSKGFPRKDKLTAHMKSMHGPEVKGLVAAE